MTKTTNPLKLLAMLAAFCLLACKKDKPSSLATLSTSAATEITTSGAKIKGMISNDGNNAITERGLVYSDVIKTPTLANTKVVSTSSENNFEVNLTGLSSGTTYYVRAYATNSMGTAYGNTIELMTGNAAPVAGNVAVTGSPEVNKVLTASYTYTDAEGDAESGTTFKWYAANDAAGNGAVVIDGATSSTYIVQAAQQGKYIAVAVSPKASKGTVNGLEVKSAYIGAVGEATTVTFTYNGKMVTYGILTSAKTQRKWLDRNLGAPGVASKYDDFANYGDLFQWGRLADGHQLTVRGASDAETSAVNGVTASLSPSDDPATKSFIINTSGSDWRSTPNVNLWQGVNGINNPCPQGWRIPTREEWAAESIANAAEGYSKLKLTLGGMRWFYDANYQNTTSSGRYWTATINPEFTLGSISYGFVMRVGFTSEGNVERASGLSCRCIKN